LSTAGIIEQLSRFDGPPEQFLVNLLAVQCRLASAEAGAILRAGPDGNMELLAVWPQLPAGSTAPVWMAQAVESSRQVVSEGSTAIKPVHDPEDLYGQAASRHLIMLPILGSGSVRGLEAFLLPKADAKTLAHSQERLELSMSLLSLYEMRLTLQRRRFDLQRLRQAMETLAAVNEHRKAAGAGMTFCNEVVSRWNCDRAGLGFVKGRSVKLKALSNTEKIVRKMKLVQDLEAAMEECLDQDVEVFSPSPKEATYVSRASDELSRLHGPMAVVSLPLRRGDEVVGVLTAERPKDNPLDLEELESLRLTADLCTARLHELAETDHWFGARAAMAVRKGLAVVVGPKHTWAKIAAVAVFVALAFILLGKGNYQAKSTFVIEAQTQRFIPCPFDGYIEAVYVQPGDKVIANETVLGKLETAELESELARAKAQLKSARTQADKALFEYKIAEAQIAIAQAEEAQAQIDLLDRKISEASIRSPITGTVTSPDLSRRIRDHVAIGDPMFEVAPLESLRAELSVPEDMIADVDVAFRQAKEAGEKLTGQLATESRPGDRIDFEVERVNPVAEVDGQENVFKVRVKLAEVRGGMLPNATGIAKINIDKRSYAYIWTRKLVNWVRMKLWI